MTARSFVRNMVAKAGIPALSLIFMGFFGYNAILGPNGLLKYPDYARQIDVKQAQFAELDKQRADMRNRVRLVDPKHADPDMVDELVRDKLGVSHPDEIVILLDK